MAGSNFEMQMGQLADAKVSQDAPSLVPYKVGFQLIEKNDDETRGVGVLVYRVKNEWIYIPVFYLNGEVRGNEEMYLPASSQFLPVNESWLGLIKSRQPVDIGEPVDRKDTDLARGKPTSINLINLDRNPFSKHACLLSDKALQDMQTPTTYQQDAFDLRKIMPRLGKQAMQLFTDALGRDTDFANAILKYYSPEDLRKMAEAVDTAERRNLETSGTAKGSTELRVITPDMPDAAKLQETEREALLKDGIFIIDNRKETSSVFRGEIDHRRVSTPTATGLYDILMCDGTFNRFYVLFPNKDNRKGNTGREVLTPDDHKFVLIPLDNTDVYLRGAGTIQGMRLDITQQADTGMLKSLGKSLDLIYRERFTDALISDTAGNSYHVWFEGPKVAVGGKLHIRLDIGRLTSCRKVEFVEFTGKPGRLFIGGDTLYAPEGARVIDAANYETQGKYVFGNPNTLVNSLINKVGLKPLHVYSDGTNITLKSGDTYGSPMDKKAAIVELATKHGIAAPTAKHIVKEASNVKRSTKVTYLIKYAAAPFGNTSENSIGAKYAPDIEVEEVVGGRSLADQDMRNAIKASDNGVKEVMDVGVLKALANTGVPLETVQEMTPDLVKAVDRIGRLIFLFYWHNDMFKEKYGSTDMKELEDSLRSVFKSLGDLTLYLSKKTISSDSAANVLIGNLSKDLGA